MIKLFTLISFLILIVLCNSQPAISTQAEEDLSAIREDLKAIKEEQKLIKSDIQEIKNILRQKKAPAEFKETMISVENDPIKGEKKANLVLIEFSDYQ